MSALSIEAAKNQKRSEVDLPCGLQVYQVDNCIVGLWQPSIRPPCSGSSVDGRCEGGWPTDRSTFCQGRLWLRRSGGCLAELMAGRVSWRPYERS